MFVYFRRRFDCFHSYWKYSLCCGSWGFDDTPVGTSYNGNPHLSPLLIIQANCGTCRSGIKSKNLLTQFCLHYSMSSLFTNFVFQITVSPDSRNTAWVSFDGRKRQELIHGDRYEIFFSTN